MTTSKWISLFSVLSAFLMATPVSSQESTNEQKSETKIIIIEETTDRFGNTTRTKTVREGAFTDEEIEAIIEEEADEMEDSRFNRSPFEHNIYGKGGYLGVRIENSEEGVRITEVTEGSAAEKSGLQAGDILTSVNDATVKEVEELVKAVSAHEAGTSVNVAYNRAGESLTTEATLGERPRPQNRWDEEDHKEKIHKFKRGIYEKKTAKADKPRLGVGIDDVEEGGTLVTEIYEGSVAASAGLKEGDIITKFNGVVIENAEALVKAVRDAQPGHEIEVEYIRDGETHTAKTTFEK